MKVRFLKRQLDAALRAHIGRFMWPGYSVRDFLESQVMAKRWLARKRLERRTSLTQALARPQFSPQNDDSSLTSIPASGTPLGGYESP